jgi:hypothetical protein
MKARTAFVSLCVYLAVGASSAWAGAPLGPTLPIIDKGQWAFGIEYAYEKIDLEADGRCVESIFRESLLDSQSYHQEFTIDSMKTNMLFGRIEYALCKDWEVFVRLGASDADADIEAGDPGFVLDGGGKVGFDGSYGFAGGLGTRATLYQNGPWRVEGQAQVTWLDPDDSDFRIVNPESYGEYVSGSAKLDYMQAQIGLTAVYRADVWSVWAGPFVQFIDGDLDLDARYVTGDGYGTVSSCSLDVEESSQVGLSIGADCEVNRHLIAWVEGQITGDSWLISVGGILHPDQLLGEW